ncbi:MAG TPA: hypothetical protein PK185_14850 [Cyclobacteriaceae bacterium]|nr:hypothetical protein [Cyclobacteriaceae bacterium]
MKKIIITSCVVFIIAAMLSACSEDNNDPNQGPNEIPLKAEAGPDQTVAPFTLVTLDGSASTGPESGISYQWIITGSASEIYLSHDGTNLSKVTFEPKVNGTYTFTLRITSGSNFSEDYVTVTVTGALALGGTLTQTTTLVDVDPDSSMPDYILSSDLIIPDGVTLNFANFGTSNSSITIKVTNNSGIIVQAGGSLNINGGSNHKLTADTGWKGILVDGGAVDLYNFVTIDKAGASPFAGQTEAAAITFAGVSPQIGRMQSVHFTNSPSRDILATTFVSASNNVIYNNTFSNAIPVKAPIDFVNKIGTNQFGTYDYVQLVPSGAGTIDALPGSMSFNFGNGIKYFIDGDFTSGSPINISNTTILMKEGAGILAQHSTTINQSTLKGVNGTNWKGIAFAASSRQLLISNTTIENAGSNIFNTGFFTSAAKAVIYFGFGGSSFLSNVTITNSGGYGVYNDSPSDNVEVKGSSFSGTTLPAVRTRVDLVHSTFVSSDNTFTMPSGVAPVEVQVPNASVSPTSTWRALGGSNYYLFSGNAYLSYGSWTLLPGVNLKFKAGKSLNILGGGFTAIGTALAPITFDSEAGTSGSWAGIHVQTTTKFEFCEIKNGGEVLIQKNGVTPATEKANVVFDYGGGSTSNTFKNNTVSGSGGYGILVEAGRQDPDALNVANSNTFSSNTILDVIVK